MLTSKVTYMYKRTKYSTQKIESVYDLGKLLSL